MSVIFSSLLIQCLDWSAWCTVLVNGCVDPWASYKLLVDQGNSAKEFSLLITTQSVHFKSHKGSAVGESLNKISVQIKVNFYSFPFTVQITLLFVGTKLKICPDNFQCSKPLILLQKSLLDIWIVWYTLKSSAIWLLWYVHTHMSKVASVMHGAWCLALDYTCQCTWFGGLKTSPCPCHR